MKKHYSVLLLFLLVSVLSIPRAKACFGDKLGLAHPKGAEEELATHIVAIYIKEKTGIGSVINELADETSAKYSLKDDKNDIIVMIGKEDALIIETLEKEMSDSRFFTLFSGNGKKAVLRVSKVRLKDMKFFTLNKVMDKIGSIITADEFNALATKVKSGDKFPKQAAREYLVGKDLI